MTRRSPAAVTRRSVVLAAAAGRPEVEIRRSSRRRRTVSAYRDGDRVVVLMPDRLSRREEAEWVTTMVARLERQRRKVAVSDTELEQRARHLVGTLLPEAGLPASVRWATNQHHRWGSCTPADRTIRLSTRLRGVPLWVLDYVLMHELAHLVEASHSARFHALVARYDKTARAEGFLDGLSFAADRGAGADGADPADAPAPAPYGAGAAHGAPASTSPRTPSGPLPATLF